MLDLQFDLPEQEEKGRYVITEKMVKGLESLVKLPLSTEEATAAPVIPVAQAQTQENKRSA